MYSRLASAILLLQHPECWVCKSPAVFFLRIALAITHSCVYLNIRINFPVSPENAIEIMLNLYLFGELKSC